MSLPLRLSSRHFISQRAAVSLFLCQRRWASSLYFGKTVHNLKSDLKRNLPMFRLNPSRVRVLKKPQQFYDTLLDMIQRAEERIFISSLYIGSEETELIAALQRQLKTKPTLQLHMVLDLNRSTRPGPSSTARILLPLLQEFSSQVHISMFRSPSLRGIMAKLVPPRFNEGWGTWHAKIYGVDNEVMISGANLNKSYFQDRQDRYVHFLGENHLAQYCVDYMQTAATFSFKLLAGDEIGSENHSYTYDDYTLHWPLPNVHPHHFHHIAEAEFKNLQKRYLNHPPTERLSASNPVVVFPIIQAGQFNIREEEQTLRALFRHLTSKLNSGKSLLDLTSGYFSLYKPYQDLILGNSDVNCRVVAASPKANGFYGSRGISGRIPEGYTLYEQRFMRAVAKAGRLWKKRSDGEGEGVLLSEWEKPGWTYHAKGIWLSPSSSSPPVLTLFGSTNLNSRSAHIDTELSFLMMIPSENESLSAAESINDKGDEGLGSACLTLRQDLAHEIEGIRSNAVEWKGGHRKVRWSTKFIVWLVKGML